MSSQSKAGKGVGQLGGLSRAASCRKGPHGMAEGDLCLCPLPSATPGAPPCDTPQLSCLCQQRGASSGLHKLCINQWKGGYGGKFTNSQSNLCLMYLAWDQVPNI